MEKLKRAVIKEELVALTGDFKKAIVLNQMIYWSERMKDKDDFINEEIARSKMAMSKEEIDNAESLAKYNELFLSKGWIYKSAEQLSEETLMKVSKSTMSRFLKELTEKGWLDSRKNPHWKGDNTFQYRVNLIKIQTDLQAIGYNLDGYPLIITTFNSDTSQFQNDTGSSKMKQAVSKQNRQFQNDTTLPEITSEIPLDITLENERDNIIIAILKNYGFEQEDIMHIHSDFASIPSKDFKKHLFIKQASDMLMRLKRGEAIFHKPKYFRTGYAKLLEAERMKVVKKEEKSEHVPTVPFYNWLES